LCRPSVRPSVCILFLAEILNKSPLIYSDKQYGFEAYGLWVNDLDQEYNTFTSTFPVPMVQIEHVRAQYKGLSAGIVLNSRLMVTCAPSVILNPAKPVLAFYKFFSGVKIFACGAFLWTFSELPFHENFAIGPFFPKISPAVLFNVYFLLLCLSRGPKSNLPGAREDLNPALNPAKVPYSQYRSWWCSVVP
jgi:hypothetical protein